MCLPGSEVGKERGTSTLQLVMGAQKFFEDLCPLSQTLKKEQNEFNRKQMVKLPSIPGREMEKGKSVIASL